ncbi:MAG TPA: hypothetical protein VLX64_06020 [Thermoplasmata archaeon]|nr:hypothetical protein [Thermoplasmata archaeon]
MPGRSDACPDCGSVLPPDAEKCPACGRDVDRAPAGRAPPAPSAPPPPTDGRAFELLRRVARLKQWSENVQGLGVTVPTLPAWAEETIRHGPGSEAWVEVVRGVERLAQKRLLAALEAWEKSTRNRLARLEAYSVDSRLEHEQIDDVLHAAHQGELAGALQTYQQVDRVVALKERHLDQAREELERLVSLLRDMEALDLPPPVNPAEAAEELERELRGGHLAPLKQQLRAIRLQAVNRLKTDVPNFVADYGTFLVRERGDSVGVELEAGELARAAHSFVRGHPEEALRRLRVLLQVHGAGFVRSPSGGRS